MMKIFLFLALFIVSGSVLGQVLVPLDNDDIYSKIEKSLNRDLPEDFFIINLTTGVSINTNAPAVINEYIAIREKYGKEMLIILVVKDENAVGAKNLKAYFEDNFLIDFHKDKKIKIAHRDKLYEELKYTKSLATTLYFHKKLLYFKKDCKLTKVENYNLPTSLFKIKERGSVLLDKSEVKHGLIGYYGPLDSQNVVCVTDFKAETYIIDIHTGKPVHQLNLAQFNAVDLYEEFITKNKKEVQLAREMAGELEKINRNQISIETVRNLIIKFI